MSGAPAKRRRLDSEDDEDEYVAVRLSSPLLQHATSTRFPTDEVPTLEDGEGASDVAERLASSRAPAPATYVEADDPADVARSTAAVPAAEHLNAADAPKPHLFFEEDGDVPAEYEGLLSAELLNVLFVPLDYICKQRSCTDQLLSQYAPTAAASHSAAERKSYHNTYGIAPGFRWDGVVRGRGPVD
ncbi:conserved hypothetical protein [Leishmania major strain Friedlin]|uniref:Pre-mRNA-splicing factor of RES complex n=1 Tax=Leishmania major TaxID=5664 RepID=Q4QA72_LEIMA|nr:conserved hypothetical protein [Leishmania major strain Friedlin]CAG9575032.1 Pre-mRNA-splicing_factor_of_RES_complex_-_putative [Leishmania major strain Friedlin]CAJ04518.1 conserved hypothetical protein [Leishmania major strain Friedlin]|eukprot:XP_001683776.1 conserved hypothetical protein [Leishmania major strain Friedlin]